MTGYRRGMARLRRAVGKGWAGLMISGAFTMAGLPWTLGDRLGPPDWLVQRLSASAHGSCPLQSAERHDVATTVLRGNGASQPEGGL